MRFRWFEVEMILTGRCKDATVVDKHANRVLDKCVGIASFLNVCNNLKIRAPAKRSNQIFDVAADSLARRIIGKRNSPSQFRLPLDHIENDVPQPQLEVALGLSTTNRAPISSSVKSITAFERNGSETESTTTF